MQTKKKKETHATITIKNPILNGCGRDIEMIVCFRSER